METVNIINFIVLVMTDEKRRTRRRRSSSFGIETVRRDHRIPV